MIELRTPAEIEQMRPAGRFVADVLTRAAAEAADVGVNLLELDALAHEMIRERGAESCYIDYHPSFGAMPFGKVLCTSVNDAVLHGLPHDYVLRDGDLLSARLRGRGRRLGLRLGDQRGRRHAARSRTSTSSTPPTRALDAGIAAARAGNRIGDISAAIAAVAHARRATRSTPTSAATASAAPCTATRTSRTTAAPAAATRCKPGLVIAIEPWFLQTTDELYTDRGRLDAAQRRRLARRAHGAHHRDHRRRPAGAHRPRLTVRSERLLELQLAAHDPVAERLVDRDHVVVGLGVPGVDGLAAAARPRPATAASRP